MMEKQRRLVYDLDSPDRKIASLRDDVALLSHDESTSSVYESDARITGKALRFASQPPPPSKRDVTILLLANPRSGSRMAGRWVTDYPKETSKLVVQGDNCMTSCRLVIFDVTDKEDKKAYFQEI